MNKTAFMTGFNVSFEKSAGISDLWKAFQVAYGAKKKSGTLMDFGKRVLGAIGRTERPVTAIATRAGSVSKVIENLLRRGGRWAEGAGDVGVGVSRLLGKKAPVGERLRRLGKGLAGGSEGLGKARSSLGEAIKALYQK